MLFTVFHSIVYRLQLLFCNVVFFVFMLLVIHTLYVDGMVNTDEGSCRMLKLLKFFLDIYSVFQYSLVIM